MDIDFTSSGLGSTTSISSGNGRSVSVGNVSFTFDSISRLFGTAISRDISISFNGTMDGYLTGRRPAYGQMYPRGVYNK